MASRNTFWYFVFAMKCLTYKTKSVACVISVYQALPLWFLFGGNRFVVFPCNILLAVIFILFVD